MALYIIKILYIIKQNEILYNTQNKKSVTFSDISFLAVLGNHDFGEILNQDIIELFAESYQKINQKFQAMFYKLDKIARHLIPYLKL